jgi:tetratricopeptide (TPR) repeat protein
VVLFLATLVWGSLLFAQSSPVDQAWDLAAKGQRQAALEILHKTIANNPSDADARLLLGSLLSDGGNAPEAIGQLSEAVRLRPQSADAQNALGEAYMAAGNAQLARAPFEAAVKINPRFAIAQVNLGAVLIQTGGYASAAEHLDLALKLLGKDADAAYAHYLRAKVYGADNDPRSAVAQLEMALALRPDYPEAWSDLGQARKLLLDDRGALAAEKRAVDLNPRDAVAQYRLGAEYLRQGQPAAAVPYLQEAFRLNPHDQSTLNALQSALRREGKEDEAAAVKQKLRELLRGKDQASQNAVLAVKLNNEGASLEKAGDLPGALERYRKAVGLYPEHVGMRVNYAVILLRLGQWMDGFTELQKALELDPANQSIWRTLQDALKQAPPTVVAQWKRTAPEHSR